MSDQQLATADQSNAPDIPATLATRRGLKLPAFPVAAAPPDSSRVAPCVALDLPRTKQVAKGNLRRFPLRSGRPLIGGERSSTRAMPRPVAPPLATLTPQHDAPTRSRRVLLPAAPAEPQVVAQEVRAQAYPALTGAGSIIDRKVSLPSPTSTVAQTATGHKARLQKLHSTLPDSPVLLAVVLLAIGVVVLLWTLVTRPPHPYNTLLLGNAIGLCLAGALVYGLNIVRARRGKRPPTTRNRHRS